MRIVPSCRPTAAAVLAALTVDAVADPHALATGLLTAALDDGQLELSVGNCHVAGVDSIVLFDDRAVGGGMLRFFFARHGRHHLHQLYTRSGHFTLGVHNHRYPLALIPLTGNIVNIETQLSSTPTGTVLHEYGFRSALADDDSAAVETVHRGERHVRGLDHVGVAPGGLRMMDAEDLHTVVVPEQAGSPGSAWLVLEGPDAGEGSRLYSPRGDLTISSDDLYLPMPHQRARAVTERVLQLAERG
jgi:hypothetical protein